MRSSFKKAAGESIVGLGLFDVCVIGVEAANSLEDLCVEFMCSDYVRNWYSGYSCVTGGTLFIRSLTPGSICLKN